MLRSIAALLLVLVSVPTGPSVASTSVDVYAHRGGAALYPENTLGAFRAAHDRFPGVWLELDVQLARDGVLVVIHDQSLDRTTDCSGAVADRTSAELAGCNAAEIRPGWPSFEPVPTLRAVLAEGASRGWRLLVELKNIPGERNFEPAGERAALALLQDVHATGFPRERIAVQSFFPTSLDQIELRSSIATALLTTSQLPHAPPGGGFYATENGVYATARGYEITAPDHTSPDLGASTVAAIQALGRRVVVWTVNDPAVIDRVIGWGVDGIISDRPDLVYDALG